jgi:hypothetical protein
VESGGSVGGSKRKNIGIAKILNIDAKNANVNGCLNILLERKLSKISATP